MELLLLRVEEASRVLGLGRSKVYQMIACGELPSITFGRSRRVPAEALRQWVAARVADTQGDRCPNQVDTVPSR